MGGKKGVGRLYYRAFKFGLPEVEKLSEVRKINNPVRNRIPKLSEVQKINNPVRNRIPIRVVGDGGKNTEDRISKLHDDILRYIISLLTMREGAATSILSRRWRDLWNTSVSCLNFDDSNLFGYKYPHDIRGKVEMFQVSQRTKFIRRADHILQLRRALKMDTLRVCFPLYEDSADHIDRWVELAAAQGVTKLELNFGWPSCVGLSYYGGKKYKFLVQRFGSSLNYLDIRSADIEFPPNFQGLNSLVSLNLCQSLLTDNDVQNILSNCHSLEWLNLRFCDFPNLTVLEFVGPTIRLKHLHISDCKEIEKIEVQDVNLLSIELVEIDPKLSIKNVPRLARAVLHMDGPVEISGSLPRLETLFLEHEESELPKLSVFNNLKHLVFTADYPKSNLVEVVYFLEACPLLQKLELDMRICNSGLKGQSSKVSSRHGCSHHNLKEVHIYAFDSHPEIVELASYLLKNAIVLEKMIVHTTCKSYRGNGLCLVSEGTVKLVGMSLENVRKQLQKETRSTTELLIV